MDRFLLIRTLCPIWFLSPVSGARGSGAAWRGELTSENIREREREREGERKAER